VMKSADICVQGFSGIELGINLPAGCSVRFLFCWQASHPSTYRFTSLVIPSHQKLRVTNSTVFHCPPCPLTGVSWCNQIIFALSLSSFGTYTFPSLYIIPSTSLHSSSLNYHKWSLTICNGCFDTLKSSKMQS